MNDETFRNAGEKDDDIFSIAEDTKGMDGFRDGIESVWVWCKTVKKTRMRTHLNVPILGGNFMFNWSRIFTNRILYVR